MTRDQLERILREWLRRLRLGHWDIQIRWHLRPGQKADGTGEIDAQSNAEIHVHEHYEQASIRLHNDWSSWTPLAANQIIVHELLHVFERGTDQTIKAMAPDATGALSNVPYQMLLDRYTHETENWVDRLAIILVDLAGIVGDVGD